MSEFKDLFSLQSREYARFRPTYPKELFAYLASLAPARETAWDCATGSGQAALRLAEFFDRVVATDPSAKQLSRAAKHSRIVYRAALAESSGLDDGSVDLITTAQAFHWFDQERFFKEAARVLKPGGILAFWCYAAARISPAVDAAVRHLYADVVGPYWEKERRLVEEGYRGVVMPFRTIDAPRFEMSAVWSLEHLIGYLSTWSALQTYIKKKGSDPLEEAYPQFQAAWGNAPSRPVRWDIALHVGRK